MSKRICLVLLALSLSACAVPYSKPGVTESQARSQYSDCEHTTGAYAHSVEFGAFGLLGGIAEFASGTASSDSDHVNACMVQNGYTPTSN